MSVLCQMCVCPLGCNFSPTRPGLHPLMVHAWEVFDWWTGALVDRLVEPSKRGVVPDCTRELSMSGKFLTSGLVHSWTDLYSL